MEDTRVYSFQAFQNKYRGNEQKYLQWKEGF